ncbi:MAG TPA: FHA domain-containing protein [Pyrinomonadaceae bacterium]|nr:FHA domain-containing protein [Pyrinomonadaceae bacterium]
MSQPESTPAKKSFSPDWFVRGILTKLGEAFDRFTGRNWKPASSLATSQLIEKLKTLLDAEAKDLGEKGKVVPHHIQLKMQWDKFSIDAEQSLKNLETELLTAAIDHINDRRYHTYAPMQFEIKPDYFTEGVKLSASFDKFADEKEDEPDEVNVTVPDLKNVVIASPEKEIVEPEKEIFIASFTVNNQRKQVKLAFSPKERKSVGRTKENDLWLDDAGVSKLHASLVLNGEGQMVVADTGSTNGTFINGVRIAYGKAIAVTDADKLSFGTVDVELWHVLKENTEEKSAVQISSVEDFAANRTSSNEENVRMKNGYVTKEEFSINESAASEQILPEKISPITTAEDFITKDDFAKAENSLSTEKEIVADFDAKTRSETAKDKV